MGLLINGEYVDDELIRQEMANLRPHYEAMVQDMEPVAREIQLKEWSRENVVERVLLAQVALSDPAPVSEEEINERLTAMLPPPGDPENCEAGTTRAGVDKEAMRNEIVAQLKLERLVKQIGDLVPKPRKQEVADFYRANQERFATPPMVNASHIVKNVNDSVDEATAREAIEKAQAELQAGVPFAEVADRYSDCAGQGGSLGWFPLGEMVEEFETVVFGLSPGEVSPIFRSIFGFHIATVHEKREAGVRPLAEVRSEIEALITADRRERALEVFVDKLKEKAEIKSAKRPAAV